MDTGETAFIVKVGETVVSLIDDSGNLRMTGYLLEDGIPYGLPKNDTADIYYPE